MVWGRAGLSQEIIFRAVPISREVLRGDSRPNT